MNRLIRWTMVVAFAAAAHAASAQTKSPLPGTGSPTTPPPASTPPVTPPPNTTPPASTSPLPGTTTSSTTPGAANDPAATPAMQQVHLINVQLMQAGQLAEQKGSTANVRDYGKRLAAEHQRFDSEIKQMAQKRGVQLATDQQIQTIPEHKANIDRLNALSGIQFDQAVMDLLVRERENRVPELKKLRDSIPGRDAELKKWLSDMEVTMEHTRNEARNVRQAVREQAQQQQRQGRKP